MGPRAWRCWASQGWARRGTARQRRALHRTETGEGPGPWHTPPGAVGPRPSRMGLCPPEATLVVYGVDSSNQVTIRPSTPRASTGSDIAAFGCGRPIRSGLGRGGPVGTADDAKGAVLRRGHPASATLIGNWKFLTGSCRGAGGSMRQVLCDLPVPVGRDGSARSLGRALRLCRRWLTGPAPRPVPRME